MTRRMLIDAAHAEETRVVVANESELLEFDYETTTKRQLKGNIYLAKVTRVEPSLQAAFVDFGGNRHGFLAFNEIHPDYYRIPVEDREALMAESEAAEEADEPDEPEEPGEPEEPEAQEAKAADAEAPVEPVPATVEVLGDDPEDDIAELGDAHRRRLRQLTRMYKIQEVIKRRQILLVQVVKEERGNKGAALTTYLSLPGRYCVLMPNTSRGGGISRKVSNPSHRKRMKTIMGDLDVPDGMAVIMRTAGVERNKAEVRRDYEYLRRTWDEIREQTLKSSAPALIYEEGDVVKRALRDVYNRDIDEIIVDGEEAYKTARALMRTMMPSHVKRIKKYADTDVPLFHRFKIEKQLDEIYDPVVHLRSGGYIVINPTEALVAIDVNSGRATRERNVEQTARRTNLEAADEVARQLRLRDLAGLIVIDFIDMDESRNNAAVERRMKEAMKADRARIQIGRISPLGLLELSRQRLRPSIHEASAQVCVRCGGSGFVRSTESTAVRVLRAIEEEGIRQRSSVVTVKVPTDVALYILNQKRDMIVNIESRYSFKIVVAADTELTPPDFIMELASAAEGEAPTAVIDSRAAKQEREEAGRGRRQREHRRDEAAEERESAGETTGAEREPEEDEARPSSRRRGRRGGRRRRRGEGSGAVAGEPSTQAAAEDEDETVGEPLETADDGAAAADAIAPADETSGAADAAAEQPDGEKKPRRRARRRRGRKSEATAAAPQSAGDAPAGDGSAESESGDEGTAIAVDQVDAEGAVDASEPDIEDVSGEPEAAEEAAELSTAAASEPAVEEPTPEEPVAAEIAADEPAGVVEAEEPAIEVVAEAATETPPEEDEASGAPASETAATVNGEMEPSEPAPEPGEEPAAAEQPREPARPRRSGWWNRP